MSSGTVLENKKEACKTYIEQTKLLVTLASAFLVAPLAALALIKGAEKFVLTDTQLVIFIVAESCFILSVLAAYIVLATVAGSQDNGTFDVYRPATRISSGIQLGMYLFGLIALGYLFVTLTTADPTSGQPNPSPGEQDPSPGQPAPPPGPQESSLGQQAPPPSRHLVAFKWLADVGPFPAAQGCPPSLARDQSFATTATKLKGIGDDLAGMLLIGSADTRELRPHARSAYGTNTRLAIARADCVKELLINTLDLPVDFEMIVTMARAPKHLGSRLQPAQLESDRAVTILILRHQHDRP
jgi:hypothetical protein